MEASLTEIEDENNQLLEALQMDLEFSNNLGLTSQQLLFEKVPKIVPKSSDHFLIPNQFYEEGYAVFNDVSDVDSAKELSEKLIAHLDHKKLPFYETFSGNVQLAKVDRIPVCDDIVKTPFQALHFDMGQPIISPSPQTVYLFLALYCPLDVENASAQTRIVSLHQLLKQRKWESESIEKNILNYVKTFGDGWQEPYPVNTYRIACLARLVDAATGNRELASESGHTTGQWFRYENHSDGEASYETEKSFFKKHGLDLSQAEKRITLKPGQLLVVDNLRTAHGRIGKRRAEEIYQFLFGVKGATVEDINAIRKQLLSEFL